MIFLKSENSLSLASEKNIQNKHRILEVLVNEKERFSKEGLNDKFSGNTPILLCDDDETVKRLLLEYGANPSITGNDGFNAIDNAFRKNKLNHFNSNSVNYEKKFIRTSLLQKGNSNQTKEFHVHRLCTFIY